MGFDFSNSEDDYPDHTNRLPVVDFDPDLMFIPEEEGTDTLAVRVSPSTSRQVEEMVMDMKAAGLPIRTKSDLLRYFVKGGLITLINTKESSSPDAQAWAMTQRNLGREARNAAAIMTARDAVVMSVQSWRRHVEYGEWEEAHKGITRFLLSNSVGFTGHEYLARAYRRELFGNSEFHQILEKIGQHMELSDIVVSSGERYREDVART